MSKSMFPISACIIIVSAVIAFIVGSANREKTPPPPAPEPAEAAPVPVAEAVSPTVAQAGDIADIIEPMPTAELEPCPITATAVVDLQQGTITWVTPTAEVAPSFIDHSDKYAIKFEPVKDEWYVEFNPDGTINIVGDVTLNEAARKFWDCATKEYPNWLQNTIAAGEVCKLKGHWWEGRDTLLYNDLLPYSEQAECRKCRLCGRTERKEPGRWVGEVQP